jgi:S1-C subfamily serine protease
MMIHSVHSQTELSFIHDTNVESLVFITATRVNANGTKEVYTGTGFIVAPGGFVLTCSHLIPDRDRNHTNLTGAVGGRYDYPYPLTFVDWDNQREGLTLLKLPEISSRTWTSVKSGAEAERGNNIIALGFPEDKDLVVVPGSITGIDFNGRWFTDAALSEGMSGGPVFDLSGLSGLFVN